MSSAEEFSVEIWRIRSFARLGFDAEAIDALMLWGADTHEVAHLLYRGDERTSCTYEQALEIVRPDGAPAVGDTYSVKV